MSKQLRKTKSIDIREVLTLGKNQKENIDFHTPFIMICDVKNCNFNKSLKIQIQIWILKSFQSI
jgi:hypothetical protein